MTVANFGLVIATAISAWCAYQAGVYLRRWVFRWSARPVRRALFVIGMLAVVNLTLVIAAAHISMLIPWGLTYVVFQVLAFCLFLMLCFLLSHLPGPVLVLFLGFSIATLAVQLVGVRLAFASQDVFEIAGHRWSFSSFALLTVVAVMGILRGHQAGPSWAWRNRHSADAQLDHLACATPIPVESPPLG